MAKRSKQMEHTFTCKRKSCEREVVLHTDRSTAIEIAKLVPKKCSACGGSEFRKHNNNPELSE